MTEGFWSRSLHRLAPALIGALLLLAACGGEPPPPPAPPPPPPPQHKFAPTPLAASQLDQAWQQMYQGYYPKARETFSNLFKSATEDKDKAAAMLGLARLELAQGRRKEAVRWLDLLLQAAPEGPASVEGAYLLAKLARQGNDATGMRRALTSLVKNPVLDLDPSQYDQVLKYLLAEAGRQRLANGVVRTIRYQAHQPLSPAYDELTGALARIAADMDPERLARLLATERDPDLRTPLMLGLAWAYMNKGDVEQAGRLVAQLKGLRLAPAWEKQVALVAKEASQAGNADIKSVGVILPLSGDRAQLGRGMLAAVKLGLGMAGASGNPPSVHVEDSRSNPLKAALAVNRLVRQKNVSAIIGLVDDECAQAAASRAQSLGVSLICLNPDSGVVKTGQFVFNDNFTPAQEIAAALGYVVNTRNTKGTSGADVAVGVTQVEFGNENFVKPIWLSVLAPNDDSGHSYARLIQGWARKNKSRVLRVEFYDPAARDFARPVKSLLQLPQKNFRPKAPGAPQPVIDFHALYLPDTPKRVAILAPQLHYWGLTGVTLVGTRSWRDPWLAETAGRYLEGCVFSDAFDPTSSRPMVTGFMEGFQAATGRRPGTMDALAHDSALMLAKVLSANKQPKSRQDVQRALAGLVDVEGVCGGLTVLPNRVIKKDLTNFTIQGGAIVSLGSSAAPKGSR